jgi:methionyl-tRNA synthetase
MSTKAKVIIYHEKVESLKRQLKNMEAIRDIFIVKHQEACLHESTEKVFEDANKPFPKRRNILKGWFCPDCKLFIPSRVWNPDFPYNPHLNKYCENCDGEVRADGYWGRAEDYNLFEFYICKICHHHQQRFVGWERTI